ncbi:TNF receptor-associated factor 3, partial [Armadillidium vulgare]
MQTICGHRFCRDCILSVLSGCSKECPIDKNPLSETDLFHDSCIEREVLELRVKCPNSSLGCRSQVDLRYIEDHIHACVYQPVLCPNECSVTVMHKELEDHITNHCLNRLSKCQFCNKTYFYNVEQVHLTECPGVKINCELCGHSLRRGDLGEHKKESCPYGEVICSFAEHGCPYKSRRHDMKKHEKEALEHHLQLLSVAYKKINTFVLDLYRNVGQVASGTFTRQPSLRSQISQSSIVEGQTSPGNPEKTLEGSLLGSVGSQQVPLNNLFNSFEEKQERESSTPTPQNTNDYQMVEKGDFKGAARNGSIQSGKIVLKGAECDQKSFEVNAGSPSSDQRHLLQNLSNKCTDVEQRILGEIIRVDNLVKKIDRITQNMRTISMEMNGKFCNGKFVWKIPNFSEILAMMKEKNRWFYSSPFYSSQFGYRFCLRINVTVVDGDPYLSLHIHTMQSENDDFLSWPFSGVITLMILDCSESIKKSDFIECMEIESPYEAFQRPKTIRSIKGYGFKEFISVSQILKPHQGCEYITNDTLYLKALVEHKERRVKSIINNNNNNIIIILL